MGVCPRADCGALQPRPFYERDLWRERKADLPKSECRICQGKRRHYVPQPGHVPEQLQGLTPEMVAAVSPLEVDVGPEIRSKDRIGRPNGYRTNHR